MNIDSIRWGNLGYREKYEDLLQCKLRVGAATAFFFMIGTMLLTHWAFTQKPIEIIMFVMAIFAIIIILLSLIIRSINRRIRGLEIFLNFYTNRHQVRHAVYCKNHLYCMVLHYFQIAPHTTRKTTTDETVH